MRNIKLLLEYEGTDFLGWQWQPTGRTVQGVLQKALRDLLQEDVKLTAAGRTDAGVHALGQVANFKTESSLNISSIRAGLNSYLPGDLVVLQADDVDIEFHARFDAVKRKYRYVISRRRRAVGRQFSWYCKNRLELDSIKEASRFLLGEHTFTAFCKAREEEQHYLCNVETIEWREDDDQVILDITANRFLHHMVRILVGTFVEVGRGKLSPGEMRLILESQERDRAGSVAPASGLFLDKIYYQED